MRTIVRTHEPPLARPAEFLGCVWRDVCRCRPLASEIAKRDIRTQYRHSLLGPTAILLLPLALTALALGFHRSGILRVDTENVPYPVYVLVGVILWTTFMEALNAPLYSLPAELRLLARTTAPPEAIVFGKLGPLLFNLLFKLLLVAAALLWYRMPIHLSVVLAAVGTLGLIVLGTAFGLLIVPFHLFYRDVSWLLSSVTMLWFFFSPVYFPVPTTGAVSTIMNLNPVTPLLADTRSWLLTGVATTPGRSAAMLVAACLFLAVSWLFARISLRVAIEQVNE